MTYINHYAGERLQTHGTPRAFFECLHSAYVFTLDGAATEENKLLPRASTQDRPIDWRGERVFCNPPWSNIPPFVELAATARLACLLVPARTNAKWFHRALALGAKVRYWKGKLKFGECKYTSPVDCLLLVFGPSISREFDEVSE